MIPFELILIIAIVTTLILIFWLSDRVVNHYKNQDWILPFCLLLGIGGGFVSWLFLSYDRPVDKETYYYITSETNETTGIITQKIYLTVNKYFNMNEEFKCVLPPKTIIRVWNYEPCKYWIRWECGEGYNHYEMIVPSHVDYEKAKEKVKIIYNGNK